MFKTSTKKLMHLARQIAGKPIEEAIVQMQLSKKKTGMDIMRHLEYAKNLAIVSRGMGLGRAEDRAGEPVEIELGDGKRKLIKDRTGIYVEQAWVNKGEEVMTPEYRGRGRVFRLTHRMASEC
jgi:ribosomal protein L22